MTACAESEKPAKTSTKKKKKKGKKKKKSKAEKGVAKYKAGDVLIAAADITNPLDKVYNRCIQNVLNGKYGPEDERVCGESLLWYAAGKGLIPAVDFLIKKGADINVCRNNATLVSQAVRSRNPKLLDYLDHKGAIKNLNWHQSNVVLNEAAQTGNVEIFNIVTEKLGNFKPSVEKLVNYAAKSGSVKMVDEVRSLAAGARTDQSLMYAAHSGSVEMLKHIAKLYPDAPTKDSQGATISMHAARSGNLEALKYAESQTGTLNSVTQWNDDIMIYAAASGSLECVKYLESKGVDFKGDSLRYKNVYIHAALSGNIKLLEYLLKKDKSKAPDALVAAAYRADLEMCKLLVEKYQADLNCFRQIALSDMLHFVMDAAEIPRWHFTPLSAAAYSGNIELVQYLLKKGAKTIGGSERLWVSETTVPPSMIAVARGGQPEIMKILVEAGCSLDNIKSAMLVLSAKCGNIGCIKYLLEQGANVNDTSHTVTALQAACMVGEVSLPNFTRWSDDTGSAHVHCVRYLMDKGADAAKVGSGVKNTPYELCQYFEQLGCAMALIKAKADCSNAHLSPMAMAGKHGSLKHLQTLLKLGHNVDDAGKNGRTALDEAAVCYVDPHGKYEQCVKFLIKKGAHFNEKLLPDVNSESIRKLVEKKPQD